MLKSRIIFKIMGCLFFSFVQRSANVDLSCLIIDCNVSFVRFKGMGGFLLNRTHGINQSYDLINGSEHIFDETTRYLRSFTHFQAVSPKGMCGGRFCLWKIGGDRDMSIQSTNRTIFMSNSITQAVYSDVFFVTGDQIIFGCITFKGVLSLLEVTNGHDKQNFRCMAHSVFRILSRLRYLQGKYVDVCRGKASWCFSIESSESWLFNFVPRGDLPSEDDTVSCLCGFFRCRCEMLLFFSTDVDLGHRYLEELKRNDLVASLAQWLREKSLISTKYYFFLHGLLWNVDHWL